MKIAGFRSDIVVLPVQELMDAVADRGGTFPCVTLRLRTDDGIEGIGVTFWGGALTKALKAAVDGLAELATLRARPRCIKRRVSCAQNNLPVTIRICHDRGRRHAGFSLPSNFDRAPGIVQS